MEYQEITIKEAKILFNAGALLECKIFSTWHNAVLKYIISIPSVAGNITYCLVSHREKEGEYRHFKTLESAKKSADSIGFKKALIEWD